MSVYAGYHGLRCGLDYSQPESEHRVGQTCPFIEVGYAHV